MTEYEAIKKAVEVMGGQTALAKGLSESMGRTIRQQHVWKWLNESRRLPELYALHVERLTERKGCRVKASELCHIAFSAA